MAKDTEDSRSKHGKQNAKHLEAVVLQQKWLKENAGKPKADWNAAALKSTQKKNTVTWIAAKQISLKLEKKTEKRMKRMRKTPF